MYERTISDLCDEAINRRLIYSHHYTDQMFVRSQPTRAQIRYVLCDNEPEIIEECPDDPRGPACLIWGRMSNGRAAHVKFGLPPTGIVVTAYWP